MNGDGNEKEFVVPVAPQPKKLTISKEDLARIKAEIKADLAKEPKPEKKFKWSFSKKNKLNKSLKKADEIVVFLLNLKRQLEGPVITKIYGGNFLVIRNRVYRFNPGKVFTMDKYKVVIAREFDRELVGVDDYQELVLKDYVSKNPGSRVNIDDPVLIKAIIQARLGEKPQTQVNSKWIIIALIVVGVAVGAFFLFGKAKPADTVATTTTT